jgi:hypothetical protein
LGNDGGKQLIGVTIIFIEEFSKSVDSGAVVDEDSFD